MDSVEEHGPLEDNGLLEFGDPLVNEAFEELFGEHPEIAITLKGQINQLPEELRMFAMKAAMLGVHARANAEHIEYLEEQFAQDIGYDPHSKALG